MISMHFNCLIKNTPFLTRANFTKKANIQLLTKLTRKVNLKNKNTYSMQILCQNLHTKSPNKDLNLLKRKLLLSHSIWQTKAKNNRRKCKITIIGIGLFMLDRLPRPHIKHLWSILLTKLIKSEEWLIYYEVQLFQHQWTIFRTTISIWRKNRLNYKKNMPKLTTYKQLEVQFQIFKNCINIKSLFFKIGNL